MPKQFYPTAINLKQGVTSVSVDLWLKVDGSIYKIYTQENNCIY